MHFITVQYMHVTYYWVKKQTWSCSCCTTGLSETLLHRFHQCNKMIHAWRYAMTLLFSHANIQTDRLQVSKRMWSLIQGSVLWITWLDHNVVCFNADSWPMQKLEQVIWKALKDHACAASKHCLSCVHLHLALTGKFMDCFDATWCGRPLICTQSGLHITWRFRRPRLGAFSWLVPFVFFSQLCLLILVLPSALAASFCALLLSQWINKIVDSFVPNEKGKEKETVLGSILYIHLDRLTGRGNAQNCSIHFCFIIRFFSSI